MALISRRRAVPTDGDPRDAADPGAGPAEEAATDGSPAEAPADLPAETADAEPASADADADADADGVEEPDAEVSDAEESVDAKRRRRGPSVRLPLVPALAVVLVLLLAVAGWLWSTRPAESQVRLDDAAGALSAARDGIVDVTSFDYLTLDDDVAQIAAVTTGDLKDQATSQLESQTDALTSAEAVASTEVVGAGVTAVSDKAATVVAVISTTQQTNASDQPTVARYRVQIELTRTGDRWLLSAISDL